VCFVLTFVCYRVIGWGLVSIQLWKDAWQVLHKPSIDEWKKKHDDKVDNGIKESHLVASGYTRAEGQSAWFLYLFLFMDVALGLLQLYWFGFGMLPKILEIVQA